MVVVLSGDGEWVIGVQVLNFPRSIGRVRFRLLKVFGLGCMIRGFDMEIGSDGCERFFRRGFLTRRF